MPADRQSLARYNDHSKHLQYNGILNMTSFMKDSLSQFSEFNHRKGSLPPVI